MRDLTENNCTLVEEPDHDLYAFPILDKRDYTQFIEAAHKGRESVFDYLYRCLYFHEPKIRSFNRSAVRSLEVNDIASRPIEYGNGETAKLVILRVNLRGCKCQDQKTATETNSG